MQLTYCDGKLWAEYDEQLLTEYRCLWDNTRERPKSIVHARPHARW